MDKSRMTRHVVAFTLAVAIAGSGSKQDHAARTDMHGDHLPSGAIARLGTLRLRCRSDFALAFSPDSKTLASAGSGGTGPIRLWEVASGKPVRQFGNLVTVRCFAFSPDGATLVAGGRLPSKDGVYFFHSDPPNVLTLWDTATGQQRWQGEGHKGSISSVAFSSDGSTIATAGGSSNDLDSKSELMLWDAATGKRKATLKGHRDYVKSVAFSADGQGLASAGRSIRLWNATTGEPLHQLEAPWDLDSLIYSPDGRILIVLTNHTIHLWDAATHEERLKIEDREKRFSSVALTPDGATLIAGCWDGTIRIWGAKNGQGKRRDKPAWNWECKSPTEKT